MLNFYDKFAPSQSYAAITVAYNSNRNLLLITSFMKQDRGVGLVCVAEVFR